MALRNWRVQFIATLACIVLAFTLGDRLVVDNHRMGCTLVLRGYGEYLMGVDP